MKPAFYLFCMLALASCHTRRSVQTTRTEIKTTDSIRHRHVERTTYQSVPMSTAHLSLPLTQLSALPEGSGYTAQSTGQARLSVRHQGDTLYVTATCDSLQRLVLYYAETVDSLRTRLQHREEERQVRTRSAYAPFRFFGYGFLTCLVMAVAFFLRYKK